jgi:hypothetical protein
MSRKNHKQRGQSLILMVLAMMIVTSAIALFTLEHAGTSLKRSVDFRRNTDVLYVMNGMARWLQHVYQFEAGCDPYAFNNKINQLDHRIYKSTFRPFGIDDANQIFRFSIGEITMPIDWVAEKSYTPGTQGRPASIHLMKPPVGAGDPATALDPAPYYSIGCGSPAKSAYALYGPQDVSVTYWVTPYNVLDSPGLPSLGTRYEQTITLINTCTSQIPQQLQGASCLGPLHLGPDYFSITDPKAYADEAVAHMKSNAGAGISGLVSSTMNCLTGGVKGDIDGDGRLTYKDRNMIRNILKNNDVTTVNGGATPTPIYDTSGNLTALGKCMDLDSNGLVNEVDLNILEKGLKGYLPYLPSAN